MRWTEMELLVAGTLFCAGLGVAGCAGRHAEGPATAQTHAHTHNASDHNHDRGHMQMASNGTYVALLTAHLSSKEGNELDIFLEQAGAPHAISAKELSAQVVTPRGPQSLAFACAPRDERPKGETEGTCSHYVAKAPWLTKGERIRVDTTIPFGSEQVEFAFRGFEAGRYAHHED
jgi:hypothetical protein